MSKIQIDNIDSAYSSFSLLTKKQTCLLIGGSILPTQPQPTLPELIVQAANYYINRPKPPTPVVFQPPYLGPEYAVTLPPWQWQ